MTAIIDANLIVVAGTETSMRGVAARDRLEQWHLAGEDLHAPQLFSYEVASGLRSLQVTASLSRRTTERTLGFLRTLDVTLHPPSSAPVLIAIARRLLQTKAYDAAYIDIALRVGAQLWTLDRSLARNARSAGFPVTLLV